MKARFSFSQTSGWLLALAAVGVAVVLAGISALNVRAEDSLQTCDELKQSAKHQLERDTNLHNALSKRYDHMLNNLMRPMNARLILNGRSVGSIAKTTDDYAVELANFDRTFEDYQRLVDDFLIARCDEETADTAREIGSMRENMVASKSRLDGLLQSYRDGVVAESEQFQWR
ncbi:hypothetical protein FWG76_02740 [Candidatus Saccharibacteria bacterium]|nr:hypothetical protein [Candidatus Saccharibacteria bacterium]